MYELIAVGLVSCERLYCPAICKEVAVAEEYEANFANVTKVGKDDGNSLESYSGGISNRITVSAGGDRWKGDVLKLELIGEGERLAVAAGECFRFAVLAAVPDWANRVDDESGGKLSGGCVYGAAGRKRALRGDNLAAFFENFVATGTMDGAIDSAAAHQG